MPEQACILDMQRCIARLDKALDGVFERLQRLADEVACVWDGCAAQGRAPAARDVAVLKAGIDALVLAEGALLHGAGVAVDPGALSDRDLYVDWWRLAEGGKTLPLMLNLNQRSENFYNYREMPWFEIPRATGHKTVAGPYVDLFGADMYVLTFALPVRVGERVVAVAAADLPLHRFERVLVGSLMRLPRESLLVSAQGRVIAANTANWTVGDLAGHLLSDTGNACLPLGDSELGWTLVCLPWSRAWAAA